MMEIVFFICLLIVPIISVASLILVLDVMHKLKAQRRLIQQLLAKSIGTSGNDELTNFIIDGA